MTEQCQSKSREGAQCEGPAGHEGNHYKSVAVKRYWKRSWEGRKAIKENPADPTIETRDSVAHHTDGEVSAS